jgi:alkylation response protein AidB-like acyl-CoA dehydrogenase
MQDVAGPLRALKHAMIIDGLKVDFSQMYLHGRRLSIYGGTNEIQRTILAVRVLGLPRAGR